MAVSGYQRLRRFGLRKSEQRHHPMALMRAVTWFAKDKPSSKRPLAVFLLTCSPEFMPLLSQLVRWRRVMRRSRF